MISRWRIITLSSLCIISTIACGFSAWVSNPYSDVSIDVEVGEVVSSEYAKHKSTTGTSYASYGFYHEDILADTTNHSYYDYNATIKSSWSLNLSKMGTNSVSLLFSIQSNVTFDFSKVTNISVENKSTLYGCSITNTEKSSTYLNCSLLFTPTSAGISAGTADFAIVLSCTFDSSSYSSLYSATQVDNGHGSATGLSFSLSFERVYKERRRR